MTKKIYIQHNRGGGGTHIELTGFSEAGENEIRKLEHSPLIPVSRRGKFCTNFNSSIFRVLFYSLL